MFYGIIREDVVNEFFGKSKNNSYSKDLNADNEIENIKAQREKLQQLNDKYKSSTAPRPISNQNN